MNNPAYIPNSYQTPNILIDEVMPLLTPQEWVVLSFATRRILGWADNLKMRQADISVSQFEKTGLSRPAIVNALEGLEKYHLLTKVGKPTKSGQRWELSFDSDVDIEGLTLRKSSQQKRNSERTSKARSSGKSDLLVNGTNQKRSVGLTATGKSDLHNETHIQTQETHIVAPAKAVASPEPKPPKIAKPKKPAPHVELLDAWLNASGYKLPAGFSYKGIVRFGTDLRDEGMTAERMMQAGCLFASWWQKSNQPVIEFTPAVVITAIRTTLQLAEQGVTEKSIREFIDARKADPFWADKTIPFKHIAENIATWQREKTHKPNEPELIEVAPNVRIAAAAPSKYAIPKGWALDDQ